jgi:hypothetical protein
LDATLDDPDATATATAWSYDWTAPGSGSFALWVRARDSAGNQDPTNPWIPFSVS